MPDFTMSVRVDNPTPVDPQAIFHVGQSFYLAGSRAALNIEIGPRVVQSLLLPSVVNYCFSIELFCKALIQEAGKKPAKIHHLKDLFAAVPQPAQDAIGTSYAELMSEPNLEELLTATSNFFQEVRYDYEYPTTFYCEYPLAMLASAAYEHCHEKFA